VDNGDFLESRYELSSPPSTWRIYNRIDGIFSAETDKVDDVDDVEIEVEEEDEGSAGRGVYSL